MELKLVKEQREKEKALHSQQRETNDENHELIHLHAEQVHLHSKKQTNL
jgi:hypothetical protein